MDYESIIFSEKERHYLESLREKENYNKLSEEDKQFLKVMFIGAVQEYDECIALNLIMAEAEEDEEKKVLADKLIEDRDLILENLIRLLSEDK